ncbi:hypothetical protein B0H13DRAFT_1574363, partial [Mycena leptocephala]
LVEEEYMLLAEMKQFKAIISPIRRLPPEIIGEIFRYFAPALSSHHHSWGMKMRAEIPWHLGQVCRYWRNVAFSMRSLW